jgi:hypothetical protein
MTRSQVAAILHLLAGRDLQAVDHFLGPLPTVTLDKPDDDVGSPIPPPAALAEHGVGLAHARRRAQVNAEVAGRLNHVGGVGVRRLTGGRLVAHTSILTVGDRRGQRKSLGVGAYSEA